MAEPSAKDWWLEERAALERGFRAIAGIDEAGRGPLAGPVVAASVVLTFGQALKLVRDSKKLTPEQRDTAFDIVSEHALAIGVGIVEPDEIDRLNILRASHKAMRLAVESLTIPPDFVLIDGLPVHPFPVLQRAIVKGDDKSASIAAASIIAKVTRDRIMDGYESGYPVYGFGRHKGYPTPEHLALLAEHGPCPIHRRSFAPVAACLGLEPGGGLDGMAAPSLFDDDRRAVGASGEIVACAHLRRMGWDVLITNYGCRSGEVDIIARDADEIVFVEVKARRRAASPAEAVDRAKRGRIAAAAESWQSENGRVESACRFDVVEVMFQPDGNARVNHLKGAFSAGE